MTLFDTLPEFDYTADDRVLEVGILLDQYDTDDIILECPTIRVEYGWYDYEEGGDTVMTINVALLQIRALSTGYCVEGGDYTDLSVDEYSTFEELYSHVKTELIEFFGSSDDTETSIVKAILYD